MEHNKSTGDVFEQTNVVVSSKRDRFLPISILVAAIVIGGAVVFATLWKGGSAGTTADNNQPAAQQQAPAQPGVNTAGIMKLGSRDAILGNPSAPVTIVEYGDYQCPFCTRYFSQTQPLIVANYVNTGKVKMVFRNLAFLGPESTAAAQAAECANDQGKSWAYHDALYNAKISDENKGGGENDGYFTQTVFIKLAQQIGLNIDQFTSCVSSNKYANLVAQEKTDASNLGVNSTPTFFVNGTMIQGAQPYANFQSAIDAALKG